MEPTRVIENLLARIEARDWAGMRALLADDVVVEWPASGERIVGPADFVAVQSEYPEGWSIRVLGVQGTGESVVSEIEVPMTGVGTFRAASFWTVRDGLVAAGREYWTGLGADPAPAWRAPFTEPLDLPPVP